MPDQPQAVAQIVITLHADGNVAVQCKSANQILALGLIVAGTDALKAEWKRQAEGPRIVPAPPGLRIPN